MSTSSHANETGLLKTICGIQTHVEFANTKANLERMLLWLEHQDVQNADLVVFPECMLSGYCFASLEEARPHAESIPGPATDAITRVCKSRNMHVVFGLLELGPQDSIYNSCVLVGPTGVISTYR
ncbi:MAG: carbon-nitrogen hydrolase family protein, partial [Pirellula sp.]